jgi:hypothetical protein
VARGARSGLLASASGRHDSGGVTSALLRGGTVTVPSPASGVAVQEFRACVRLCKRASAGVGNLGVVLLGLGLGLVLRVGAPCVGVTRRNCAWATWAAWAAWAWGRVSGEGWSVGGGCFGGVAWSVG